MKRLQQAALDVFRSLLFQQCLLAHAVIDKRLAAWANWTIPSDSDQVMYFTRSQGFDTSDLTEDEEIWLDHQAQEYFGTWNDLMPELSCSFLEMYGVPQALLQNVVRTAMGEAALSTLLGRTVRHADGDPEIELLSGISYRRTLNIVIPITAYLDGTLESYVQNSQNDFRDHIVKYFGVAPKVSGRKLDNLEDYTRMYLCARVLKQSTNSLAKPSGDRKKVKRAFGQVEAILNLAEPSEGHFLIR